MPRVTRAALRSNVMLEEAILAEQTPLSSTPVKRRAPLGVITGNSEENVDKPAEVDGSGDVGKKVVLKGKKGRAPKKGKKCIQTVQNEVTLEVLEDDNQSATSSAVDEACEELIKENSKDIHQTVMHDQRPRTPPSPAVNALKKLDQEVWTLRSTPKTSKSDNMATFGCTKSETEVFVPINNINTMPDTVPFTFDEAQHPNKETEFTVESRKPDNALLESIMQKSSILPTMRIEDSVEAIDAFQEAIERVGELIPDITEGSRSPLVVIKEQRTALNNFDADEESLNKPNTSRTRVTEGATAVKAMKTSARAMSALGQRHETTSPSQSNTKVKIAATRRSGLWAGGPSRRSDLPSTAAAATLRPISSKRVSSIHKAPFQPAKSTKAPTRPSFELPGEAVARKLKEQREERLKRGKDAATKKPVSKARPMRPSPAPVVKATTTSKARASLAKSGVGVHAIIPGRASQPKPPSRAGSMSTADGNRRLSTISITKTSTLTPIAPSASRRASTVVVSADKPRAGTSPRAPAPPCEGARRTVRGKEVFNRSRVEQDERERAKKEKEEAARKARADAAERGRIASREWAEKQKSKKMGLEKEQSTNQNA